MFTNYLKIAWRNLAKNKLYSSINIFGLTIGMASAMLILLWVQSEVSTDRFYKNTDRIYMMYNRVKADGALLAVDQTPEVMAPALKKDFPEVEEAVRFNNVTFLVSNGDKHLNVRGAFADSGFLSVFDFPVQEGKATSSLNDNTGIVLTENLAKKLFGDEDAMGKTVRIDSNANFKVTAVIKNLPANTRFDFEYLLPWHFMTQLGWDDQNWTNNFTYTYALLKPGTRQDAFDAKVKNIIIDHTQKDAFKSQAEVFTQPMSRAYLYSKSEDGKLVAGRYEMVRLFTIIAIFILLIACINFMNLSTARSEKRAKEVGVRKVSGAYRGNLILQFISESVVLAFVAFVIALAVVQLVLPPFNLLVDKTLAINYGNPLFWAFSAGFILFTGIVAGSYPAFYLSSFAPAKVLKGAATKLNAAVTPRKVLVVLQFTFAIILIICTIMVRDQLDYVQRRDIGYNKNNLVYTFIQGDADKHYQSIKDELLSSGAAVSVTRTANPITQRWSSGWGYQWQGSTDADARISFVKLGGDAGFVKTMGLTLLQGRDIDIYKYPTDSMAVLLNEAAVQAMHFKNPVGQIVTRVNYPQKWHVVGVVKNFILESPFESTVNPMIISGPSYFFQTMHFKLNPANTIPDDIAKATAIFKKYNPQYPFEYVFADESYARKFSEVRRTSQLSMLFAGLTILISCLGLFGLATYMAENRIKEIGIRKVLGARVTTITVLLSKDFLKLVIIAFVVATPVAWYAMSVWLQNYSYRINVEWWVFLLAGLLSVFIAVVTVGYQSIKAAMANPVKSLKTE
ncbi:MAG TPA: ABC transporter permease [Chitinophagaceae bacterium]|nr:ABC transporter permease [Chitinophagaceae bacterium]